MARKRKPRGKPMRTIWIIAVVLGIAGILSYMGALPVPELRAYAFWLVAAAFGLLATSTMSKGL